jgi:hypothetical protein
MSKHKNPKQKWSDPDQGCVVCGIHELLTRHHIVPKRVLKSPEYVEKNKMSNTSKVYIAWLCLEHHQQYEKRIQNQDWIHPKEWLEDFWYWAEKVKREINT